MLLLWGAAFRFIIKDRCPIPLDATVMLGPLKFNLQATIDHHGPSIDSGHYTASINCCKKTFYCNDHKITEFGITDKNSSTAYIVLYKWIDTWFLDSNRRVGVRSLPSSPSHWQQVEEQALKPVGWTMCFLLMTLVPVRKLCVNIYVYIYMCVHSLYEFCYRSYIQRECHSVLARLHPITFYRGMRGSWSECHFVFSLVYQLCLALWSQPNTRMLVTLCICLKQSFDTRYLVFYNTSSPRMFLSLDLLWEYRIQHGATDPFMSHLATQLGYSAGEFQALQLIVLATFGVVD